MKALAVFPDSREVRLVDHKEPSLESPFQIKLRMLDIGICGTDKEICAFEYGTPPKGSSYLILGHESLGEVVEAGTGVSGWKKGDLAMCMVRRPCRNDQCMACRSGCQDFCTSGDFTERGIKEAHGFMTELVVDEARYMISVPKSLREIGVLTEPLTIAEKALVQIRQVQERLPWLSLAKPGQRPERCPKALILGAGPVGLLGAMLFLHHGFETYVYSRGPVRSEKAKTAQALGAKYFSSSEDSIDQLKSKAGQIDVVYEAAGVSRLAFEIIKTMGPNAVLVLTGIPAIKDPGLMETDLLMRELVLKNQVILGTVNAGREVHEAAVRDLAAFQKRWPSVIRSLITRRAPLESYQELLFGTSSTGIKQAFTFLLRVRTYEYVPVPGVPGSQKDENLI